jgi:hypothetical protein
VKNHQCPLELASAIFGHWYGLHFTTLALLVNFPSRFTGKSKVVNTPSHKYYPIFSPVAPQSLKDLGRLTYRSFLELFRHMVGLLGRVISPLQSLYLHRTTQHRNTRTNIHALSGIRTHDPSNQPAKTHASDSTATVTGKKIPYGTKSLNSITMATVITTHTFINIIS